MSVEDDERNELLKRFGNQALIPIKDNLYSAKLLSPTKENKRFCPVFGEAIERLNKTMQRHIDGNAQIYYTMVYKDVPRDKLIVKWWSGLKDLPAFKALPEELRHLELEQSRKLGPTSRFSLEKLYDGFLPHVDRSLKCRNNNLAEFRKAAFYFEKYLIECIDEAKEMHPEEWEKLEVMVTDSAKVLASLPHDTVGGDPYMIRGDRKISGAEANLLYMKLIPSLIQRAVQGKQLYYVMYSKIRNKGNNLINEDGSINSDVQEPWLPEKNRVVQGDSKAWQILLKPVSYLLTTFPKFVSANFVGWCDQERKNEVIGATMKEFFGKYIFDSFDAAEYDGSTDPENFRISAEVLCNVFSHYFDLPIGASVIIKHFINDATLTPWGAYERESLPSGHNFTGPVGTLANMLRAYKQTRELLSVEYRELNILLHSYDKKNIMLFTAVGDDAEQLREKGRSPESIAAENEKDGFKSNADKVIISDRYIHYLQYAYYYDGNQSIMGFYPVSRVVEHGLFQERANEYSAEEVSTQALVQNINNARYNPCQDYLIDFFYEGDKKYHLGADVGVINLFKAAAGDRTVAEFVKRDWDPVYSDMSWNQYSEVLRDTIRKIESKRRKSE